MLNRADSTTYILVSVNIIKSFGRAEICSSLEMTVWFCRKLLSLIRKDNILYNLRDLCVRKRLIPFCTEVLHRAALKCRFIYWRDRILAHFIKCDLWERLESSLPTFGLGLKCGQDDVKTCYGNAHHMTCYRGKHTLTITAADVLSWGFQRWTILKE